MSVKDLSHHNFNLSSWHSKDVDFCSPGKCRRFTFSLLVFLAVNWLRWVLIWLDTRRRFCPACRACRPRGHMSKYNTFHRTTQWDRTKMDAPVKSFPRKMVIDTLCLGLHWFWNTLRRRQHGRLTPSPSRSFTIFPILDGHYQLQHSRVPATQPPQRSNRATRVRHQGHI